MDVSLQAKKKPSIAAITTKTPLARCSLAALLVVDPAAAPEEVAAEDMTDGAVAVGLGCPKPVTTPVRGPGTVDADAP